MFPRRFFLKSGTGLAASLAAFGSARAASPATPVAYQPQKRTLVISMVPVLTHEFSSFLPYLAADFAKGGMLAGKEIFAFLPAHVSAYAGDSVDFQIYNPADDAHTLTVIELQQSVDALGHHTATLSLQNLKQGIYTLACLEPEHEPFMWGQLTVLPPPA